MCLPALRFSVKSDVHCMRTRSTAIASAVVMLHAGVGQRIQLQILAFPSRHDTFHWEEIVRERGQVHRQFHGSGQPSPSV
jgi:hypothetical protein